MCFNSVQNGCWCPICNGKFKPTIEEITEFVSKKYPGSEILSDTYKDCSAQLKFKCGKGHIFNMCFLSVKKGGWCRKCKRASKFTIKDVISFVSEKHPGCDVLSDVYELKGDIKFKVTANPEKKYTFLDYDLFLSYGIIKNHLPIGGRIGILGPNKIGGYIFCIYNYTQGTIYDSGGGGSPYYETEEYVIITGGPLLNILTKNKYRLSIFAGCGYCDFTYSEPVTDWSFINDSYFVIESGAILNFNHFNITVGLEKIDNLYLIAGIGFTL